MCSFEARFAVCRGWVPPPVGEAFLRVLPQAVSAPFADSQKTCLCNLRHRARPLVVCGDRAAHGVLRWAPAPSRPCRCFVVGGRRARSALQRHGLPRELGAPGAACLRRAPPRGPRGVILRARFPRLHAVPALPFRTALHHLAEGLADARGRRAFCERHVEHHLRRTPVPPAVAFQPHRPTWRPPWLLARRQGLPFARTRADGHGIRGRGTSNSQVCTASSAKVSS